MGIEDTKEVKAYYEVSNRYSNKFFKASLGQKISVIYNAVSELGKITESLSEEQKKVTQTNRGQWEAAAKDVGLDVSRIYNDEMSPEELRSHKVPANSILVVRPEID